MMRDKWRKTLWAILAMASLSTTVFGATEVDVESVLYHRYDRTDVTIYESSDVGTPTNWAYDHAFIDNAYKRWKWGYQASSVGDDRWIIVGRVDNRDGGLESICPRYYRYNWESDLEPGDGSDYLWYSDLDVTVWLEQ